MDRVAAPALSFRLNGAGASCDPAPGERLSHVLRERLGARDVKVGCDAGDCGACTVLVDGAPFCACLFPAGRAKGATVETVAGLTARDPVAMRLAASFQDHGAAQCGICTPGMIVAATALLRAVPAPGAAQVEDALGGVLCRCTGYRRIIDAVLAAAGTAPPASLHPGPSTPGGSGGQAAPRLAAPGGSGGQAAPRLAAPGGSGGQAAPRLAAPGGSAGQAAPRLAIVGRPVRRIDGAAKVTGAEAFGDDVAPPGALLLRVVRSPHPRARFAFGDLEAWRAARPGIACILTARDVPGRNAFGVIPAFVDQPVFAAAEALYRGDAVAAVVGRDEVIRALDLADFPVSWEPLPALADTPEATLPDAPVLFPDRPGNVMCRGFVRRGDAAAALARAAVTAEATFVTTFVEHAYIEPEAGFARLEGDVVEVHACTQAPVMDRESLEAILDLPPGRIRIVPTAVGGGFGSKLDLSVQPFLALAALRTGQAVRMCYSRSESMQATTKRHPARIRIRAGADRDGRLCGLSFEGDFNTGAYASWGPTVANRVPVHASGPYVVDDYLAQTRAIHTHNPPAGAFRGFGVPQAAAAQETLFDELALRLGMDPLDFRLRNVLENGRPTVCGQVFDQGVGIGACLRALAPAWRAARADCAAFNAAAAGPLRRGAGLAAGWYGCGNTVIPNPSTIRAGVTPAGRIVLHQGAMDIGQGANTVIAQIFAEALGVPLEAVTLVGGDTFLTPDAGKTSASRQTFVSGNAARLAGLALRARILRLANAGEAAVILPGPSGLAVIDGAARHDLPLAALPPDALGYALSAEETWDPPTRPLDADGQGQPYAQFGYCAQMAVVEVDTALGTVRPLGFTAAHDVGRAINPMLVEGQVQGGIAQGLGMALMEDYVPGRTENLHDYLIPTIGDMPPVETIIIEEPDAHGPWGAKGLGEHVLIPTAPAILNAIRHACGARLTALPATPTRILQALGRIP
ncbi:MAG: molybdopterin-dependent oxidoreductase [Rhodobacteraceae bacterium]|nr:molybdopterin-dependent oxidoreductase [Paracoccaceae bacterium]